MGQGGNQVEPACFHRKGPRQISDRRDPRARRGVNPDSEIGTTDSSDFTDFESVSLGWRHLAGGKELKVLSKKKRWLRACDDSQTAPSRRAYPPLVPPQNFLVAALASPRSLGSSVPNLRPPEERGIRTEGRKDHQDSNRQTARLSSRSPRPPTIKDFVSLVSVESM